MVTDAPPRTPAPAGAERHHPVEALIEEARQHARRRRRGYAAGVAALVAVAAFSLAAALNTAGPPQGQGSSLDTPAAAGSFGVFEPVRGRIVYPAGNDLRAIDPADPSSVRTMALPDLGLPADAHPVPAAWSADGTTLALTSEYSGDNYVMNASGAITRVGGVGGCCWFVTDPWLSPDGTTMFDFIGSDRLRLRSLGGTDASRTIRLEPPVRDFKTGGVPVAAWSPDGTQIAYTAYREKDTDLLPSVHVVDLQTGITRELVSAGFGHIRQMAWSPDGSQLLLVAGPWRASADPEMTNPLVDPKEAALYLVEVGDPTAAPASARKIASGFYVAATWSPDGAQIAAIEFVVGHRLIAMNADGSGLRVLTEDVPSGLFTGLAWHPMPG